MNHERLAYLLDCYINKTYSETEKQEFLFLLLSEESSVILEQLNNKYDNAPEMGAEMDAETTEVIRYALMAATKDRKKTKLAEKPHRVGFRRRIWIRYASAAAILIVIATGSYFLGLHKPQKHLAQANAFQVHDVKAPSTNNAIITLSNGRQIILDSAGNGTLVTQGNVNLVKLADGKIAYLGSSNNRSEMAYNTLTNPRGSKVISLTLSDGSQIWLNAESSIRYPTAFAGNERKVEITGEAYFEVAHDEAMPFIVRKGEMETKVLGTHFNVNAYDNEPAIKVTLLEGSVKVSKAGEAVQLVPGQQAQINTNGKILLNKTVEIDEVVAWKNGQFELNGNTIEPIMRQVARWYDLDIEYKGALPTDNFKGSVSRQENVSELLRILEQTKAVSFSIEGKKIIVMKQ
jgi:transmembrane sensor